MYIETLKNLSDFKKIEIDNLEILAQEIRDNIIEVLSKNGGHLGSNLGIVDLTIALHYVFNSPYDKLIFDVSHQSYTHKILTGRFKNFHTIRQTDGLCGFTDPKESIHDHFHFGHAGTALSAGLGMCYNRDHLKREEHVIPIIGDASLTCGLTLEALNNINEDLKKFIIVLNDNNMAISKNVGNIKNILSRLLSNPVSNKFYQDFENLISKIPSFGKFLAHQGKKITESLKNLVSPAAFFEQQNLAYIGPIDGHNIKKLIETFKALKNLDRPVIVHVITQKGKGMEKAIQNPISYHGVRPFNVETGDMVLSNANTFPKAFGNHIYDMAEKDSNIWVINPAMIEGSSLKRFKDSFSDRCIDVGIAEGHAITFSAGLAQNKNLKVLVSIYSTFLQRAFDNLFHDICLQEIPVVFAIDRAGISGPDGSTHHGIYDISFLNAMPNMIIAQPRNENILKDLLSVSFNFKRPMAIRYPNMQCDKEDIASRKLNLTTCDILVQSCISFQNSSYPPVFTLPPL